MNNNLVYLFMVNFNFYVVILIDKVFEYLLFLCILFFFYMFFLKLYILGFCDNLLIIFFMLEMIVIIYVNGII